MKKLRKLSQEEYSSALQSGMFWKWYPEATGIYNKDCKKAPRRMTNYYEMNHFNNSLIIKRQAHQADYYYILVNEFKRGFQVMYVGEWKMNPGVQLNEEPTHRLMDIFDNLFDALDYIEPLNGNSDLH